MTTTAPSMSLLDCFTAWGSAAHPKRPGLTNNDREANDIANHERALLCLAAASGDGEMALERVAGTLFAVTESLLFRRVEEGAALLAQRSGRKQPSGKTFGNLVSCARAIRKVAYGDEPARESVRETLRRKKHGVRVTRPRFSSDQWPMELVVQFEAYKAWKSAPILPPQEDRYRRRTSRESSFVAYHRHLNIYVGHLVRDRGHASLTLEELCDPGRFAGFLSWYLGFDTDRGANTAHGIAVTLAGVCRFLVAKDRVAERDAEGVEIWDVFYDLGRGAMQHGAAKGHLPEARTAGEWKPWHLVELAEEAWESQPVHKGTRHGQRHERQLVSRKRTGLMFRLAVETPLRVRNWSEMQWGENLFRDRQGRWTVSFKGEALKVGSRGLKTNVYQRTYSSEACRWIDAWRVFLKARLGDEFEAACPAVFPTGDLKGGCDEDTLRRYVKGLVWELRGKDFNPHLFRHIVGSYAVNETGPAGLQLAADLLGDTKQVVMNTYYHPNTEEAMVAYLEGIDRRKRPRR